MTYGGEQLLAGMAMVDQVAALRDFTHGRLKHDAVEPQALLPALPPVRNRLEDLHELGLGDAVPLARLDQHLPAHAPIAQDRGHPLRQRLPAAKSASRYSDNSHRLLPPLPSVLEEALPVEMIPTRF